MLPDQPSLILNLVKVLYEICIVVLSFYGFYNLGLAILYLLTRHRNHPVDQVKVDEALPFVTIQLPVYNESSILDRLIRSTLNQCYPQDRFEIQVLDDSTDHTTQLAEELVKRYRSEGWNIVLLHRNDRNGYKAGALAAALLAAKGDYIAVLDADFVPDPDWLPHIMAGFEGDPQVGCVQSRWDHINPTYNILTSAEALALDAHFIVEQNARANSGLFFGFNGSGGVWRKQAILDAGNWQADTLTEDLDLSYRAQLKGWKIRYLPQVSIAGELPAQVDAFKNQQYRWAKGSAQTLRKLGWEVLRAPVPWYKRLMGILHLGMYLPFPFMVGILLLTLPVAWYVPNTLTHFGWTMLAGFGPPFMYSVSRTPQTPRLQDRLVRIPRLLLIGFGISLNSTIAVISGLFSRGGVFERTPKYNLLDRQDRWMEQPYALQINPVAYIEALLAIYACATLFILWHTAMGKAIAPGVLFYATSYLFMSGLSFVQSWQLSQAHKVKVKKS